MADAKKSAPCIAMYAHKGGVGKTTTILNFVEALSRHTNKRVLLVDADSQGSLTAALAPIVPRIKKTTVAQKTPSPPPKKEAKDEDPEVTRARQAMERIDAITLECSISDPIDTDAEPFDIVAMERDRERTKCSLQNLLIRVFYGAAEFEDLVRGTAPLPISDRTHLIPFGGHGLHSELEKHMRATSELHHLGAFRRLLKLAAEKVHADLVLVDFGPSATPLNELFVMSCDYILPNTSLDFHSTASMQTMLHTLLPEWYATAAKRQKMKPRDPCVAHFKFSSKMPKILPFIVTAFPTSDDGSVCDSAARWAVTQREWVEKCPTAEIKQHYHPLEEEMVLVFAPRTSKPLLSFEKKADTRFLKMALILAALP